MRSSARLATAPATATHPAVSQCAPAVAGCGRCVERSGSAAAAVAALIAIGTMGCDNARWNVSGEFTAELRADAACFLAPCVRNLSKTRARFRVELDLLSAGHS